MLWGFCCPNLLKNLRKDRYIYIWRIVRRIDSALTCIFPLTIWSLPDLSSLNHALVACPQLLPRNNTRSSHVKLRSSQQVCRGRPCHPITKCILQKHPCRNTWSGYVIGKLFPLNNSYGFSSLTTRTNHFSVLKIDYHNTLNIYINLRSNQGNCMWFHKVLIFISPSYHPYPRDICFILVYFLYTDVLFLLTS